MEETKVGDKQEARKIRLEQKQELLKSAECSKCHEPIPGLLVSSDFEPHKIDGKQVCKNCWTRELGEEIEKHPIGIKPKKIKVF